MKKENEVIMTQRYKCTESFDSWMWRNNGGTFAQTILGFAVIAVAIILVISIF